MVVRFLLIAAALGAAAASPAQAQDATVRASVDRASIRENESFTLTLRAEGAVRADPDIAVLTQDFDVLSTSTSKRIQIVDGQAQEVAEWQYQLIPLRAGSIVIPPIEVGGIRSSAIALEVLPAAASGDSVADIFMEVEAAPTEAYVQSQVVFTLRLFIGIGTGRATLTAPAVDGVEAIVERLGEDNQYQTMRDGRNFIVRERRYAVFPQQSGALSIGPVTFEAMVIPNRGFSRVQRFRSDTITVDVLPAVAPPSEYPDAVWLPATSLVLEERWSDGDAAALELGIPQTRALTVVAEGLLETQLPALRLATSPGIRQYADQPELDRELTSRGLAVRRTERYAVIAQHEGEVALAAVSVPWWNVGTRRWEVASVPARTITVLPSSESFVEPVPAGDAAPGTAPAMSAGGIWRVLSAALGLGWLLTALAWWWSAGRTRAARPGRVRRTAHPRSSVDRKLGRELLAACRVHDAAKVQGLLLKWAAARFAESPPATLGALAAVLPEAAAAAVVELEAHLYGREPGAWNGAPLAEAFKGLQSVARHGDHERQDALLPLYR